MVVVNRKGRVRVWMSSHYDHNTKNELEGYTRDQLEACS